MPRTRALRSIFALTKTRHNDDRYCQEEYNQDKKRINSLVTGDLVVVLASKSAKKRTSWLVSLTFINLLLRLHTNEWTLDSLMLSGC